MESILNDVGGCGRFHVLVVNIVHLCKIHLAFSMLFMSFGIYNPGWRCEDVEVDNTTLLATGSGGNISSHTATEQSPSYNKESCEMFESCKAVQFNPESSTIITEWGLVCDRSWIGSFIISLQMIGSLVGSFFTGYFGDKFGRKNTLLACVFLHTILNLIVVFSVSWTMFAVCRFFIGAVCAFFRFLPFVYSSEFVPPKWRGPIACHPVFATAAITFAVVCMVTKNWVQMHVVIIAVSALSFVPVLWIPKSLRWLVINDKEKEAYNVVARIANINRRQIPDRGRIQDLIKKYNEQNPDFKKYRMIDLFRKGFRMSAVIIGFLFFSDNLSYYAISLGAKSLPGNIYINLIAMHSTEYIANIYAALTGNKLGRKRSLVVSLVGSTLCLLGVAAFDRLVSGHSKDLGILILAIMVTVFNNITWYFLTAYMSELYPTVIRSTVTAWGSLTAQIGAIVAPYLIPSTSDYLYICYLIMGCLNVVGCFLFFFLEDTTKKALTDTWAKDGNVDRSNEGTKDSDLSKDLLELQEMSCNHADI